MYLLDNLRIAFFFNCTSSLTSDPVIQCEFMCLLFIEREKQVKSLIYKNKTNSLMMIGVHTHSLHMQATWSPPYFEKLLPGEWLCDL